MKYQQQKGTITKNVCLFCFFFDAPKRLIKQGINAGGEKKITASRRPRLEKEMATHVSILAWEIPWTEEPTGLQSMGLQELDMTE